MGAGQSAAAGRAAAGEQPQMRSQWDRLPVELMLMVLGHASLLTRFLCGALGGGGYGDGDGLADEDIAALWAEALSSDWPGDLGLLPDRPFAGPGFRRSLLLGARSQSMYDRLCARFPDLAHAAPAALTVTDRDMNAYVVCNAGGDTVAHVDQLRELARNVARLSLEHRRPIALGWHAIVTGSVRGLKRAVFPDGLPIGRYEQLGRHRAMDWAALGGHVGILQMLHDAGSRACSTDAMDEAARNGHLDAVVWLHEHCTEGCTAAALDWAAEAGHLRVVQWLVRHRSEGNAATAAARATAAGQVAVAKWLQRTQHALAA